MHWIVASEPRRHVGENDLISLTANLDRKTGIGRISHVSGLDKHWVTFSIAGSTPKSGIQVPIPWARLPTRVAEAHARTYVSLESIPPLHIFREDSWYRNPLVNPYWTALHGAPVGSGIKAGKNREVPRSKSVLADPDQATDAAATRVARRATDAAVPDS